MAESQKRGSSTVSSKEKDSLLDLDIGNDFLSSWKSISMAEGDGMDFDLTPGNKKPFKFDKADMDFNFDGDFGKVPSFNMDMPDLDISPPLKKDGKPTEKLKESSSGKNKGKADPFAFAFDFDELDNFNFEPTFTKESSKDQKEKSKKPSGSEFQDAEGSMHMKKTGSMTMLEDGPPKPSRPGAVVTLDMGSLDGGGADLEPTKENRSSNLAMDDVVTSGQSADIHDITSDNAKRNRELTVASIELPKDSESEKFIRGETVELEACSRNDAMRDLSSDSVPKNESTGGDSSEALDEVNSVNTNETGSTRKQDVEVISFDSSFRHYTHTNTIYENSPLQTVENEISEKESIGNSKVGVADHVINKKPMPSRNDALRDFPSNSLSKNEATGANLSEAQAQAQEQAHAQDKANSVNTNATGSTRKQDVNAKSLDSSSCHYPHTIYENLPLQTVEISEKSSSGKCKVGFDDHVVNKRQTPSRNDVVREFPSDTVSKNEPTGGNQSEAHGKVNSLNTNETGSTRKHDAEVISYNSSSCQDTRIIYENSPLQTFEISEKRSSGKIKVGVEDHVVYKMQTPSKNDAERDLSSDSLSKTEPTGGNLSEAQDKVNSVNANAIATTRKQDVNVISIDSSSRHYARTIYENSPLQTVDISEKKSSAKSKFRVEDHMINKKTPYSNTVRDLSSDSLYKHGPTGGSSSEAQDKVNSVNTNATGSNRKQDVNMKSLDSSSCHQTFNSNFDSTKFLLRKYIKPVGNIGQNRVPLRNTSSDVAHFPNSQNQTLSTLSTKRKTLEGDATSISVLPPSKRVVQSLTTSRNVVETPEKILDKKVPDHSNMETESNKSTLANSQVPTLHIPREANIKEVTMSFSIESDNIIRQAESYAKELVGLCNMLKKKQDEAKEILVQAVVNSNELLMLCSPLLDEKIFLQLRISVPDFNTEQHLGMKSSEKQQFHQSPEETHTSFLANSFEN